MATFTNFATLTYNGGATNSNTVIGQLVEVLSAAKTAVVDNYTGREDVTYVVSLVNSGSTALTGLTVTDDLGGYDFNGTTLYPLAYTEGSIRYYLNGVLQAAPAVTAGPPLAVSGITVPAGGNATLIYEAGLTGFAPPEAGSTITNTATITGGGLTAPVTAQETITAGPQASLTISKSLMPAVVSENDQLTYTFVIENTGNALAGAADNLILSDTFDPILDPIIVTINGDVGTAGTSYSYDPATGLFSTLPGQLTVPAATYTQNTDGTWTVDPGSVVITVTGTV